MPVRFTLSFWGEHQLDRTLERIEFAGQDATPAWEVMAGQFLTAERRQFASEGAFASGGWAPLKPNYAEWKARHFPGKTILRRTDDLWRSLTQGPAIRILEPTFMVLGSDVDYGAHHQHGGPNLPRRRPVELTETMRREWVRILQRYLLTGSVRGH